LTFLTGGTFTHKLSYVSFHIISPEGLPQIRIHFHSSRMNGIFGIMGLGHYPFL